MPIIKEPKFDIARANMPMSYPSGEIRTQIIKCESLLFREKIKKDLKYVAEIKHLCYM